MLRDKLRSEDYARYLCSLYAVPHKRDALMALALLNAEIARIRDITAEPLVGEVRLTWWREAVDGLYAGTCRKHDVLEALHNSHAPTHVPHALLDSMIEARIEDIYDSSPTTIAALKDYMGATSGQLQQAWVYVLCDDAPKAATLEAAKLVGLAWGLIGVVRAAGFHARQQRRFIPDDALTAAGVDPAGMVQQPVTAAIAPALKQIVEDAAAALRQARALRRQVDTAAYPALLLARLADGHIKRLHRAQYNPEKFTGVSSSPRDHLALLYGNMSHRY
jgi:NADH dehydrogenase [ubiquinone] 1 alpha subcomplex assembly factor 6